jgi:hypothetical protein
MSPRRPIKIIASVLAIVTLTAGAAIAYLRSTGSGSGSGGAQVMLNAVTVTTTTGTQSLLPTGSPTGDVDVTLHNGNSSSVHISALSLDPAQGSSGFSSNATSCALSFTTQTNGGNGWTIPANSSTAALDLTNSVTMGTTAASSCQGQTFTVYLKAS